MKMFAGALVRVAFVLFAVAGIGLGQDMTVEWKATVSDLKRRLPALPAEGTAVDAWRSDAEALRSSIASAAGSYYSMANLQLPESLPAQPSHTQLQQQFNALSAAVEFEVRSTPLARLTLNASYSFLNRTIAYDFGALPNVSAVNTSISVLPVLPKNKAIGTATVRLPHQILAIINERYESGLIVQDTTYATTSALFLPHSESYATTDLGVVAPIRAGISVQAGVKNLFDRNYFYTAGYPEIGRNWFLNFRYRF